MTNRARKCPNCGTNLISFGGVEWKKVEGETHTFKIGRLCKRCDIFYIDPRFKDIKIIYHKIASSRVNLPS